MKYKNMYYDDWFAGVELFQNLTRSAQEGQHTVTEWC